MGKLKIEKQFLTAFERCIVGLSSCIFIAFSIYLIFIPPIQLTTVNKLGVIQTTTTASDQSTVVVLLMTIGSILFFYSINGLRLIKFTAGPISGESESGQGSTPPLEPILKIRKKPIKQNENSDTVYDKLSNNEKKILRTLWKYQKLIFPDNFSNRWTFKIFANHPEYPEFLMSVSKLLKRGFINVNPENDQCAFSNEGISLMGSIGEKATEGDFYPF